MIIITADSDRAQKAKELGFESVLIEGKDFKAALPSILNFLSPAVASAPAPEKNI